MTLQPDMQYPILKNGGQLNVKHSCRTAHSPSGIQGMPNIYSSLTEYSIQSLPEGEVLSR